METMTFHMDDREWVCIPDGPITVLTVPVVPSVPPEVREEWSLHNQIAHQVLEAIKNQTPSRCGNCAASSGSSRRRTPGRVTASSRSS